MLDVNCQACEEIKQNDPSLVVNGFTDTECASFKNDTGLSPSSGHNDCEDLGNLNDCLVGNLDTEVELYDVCEWRPFMHELIPNIWTVFEAVKCAICGLWTNVHNIWDELNRLWAKITEIINTITNLAKRIEYICSLLNVVVNPTAPIYGIFPRTPYADQRARTCGFIPNKNGRPALIDAHSTSHNADHYTGVGLRWGKVNAVNCSTGQTVVRYFWKPYIWGYKLNKNLKLGDALWVISKSQLQSLTEWSDALWQAYTDESWTWIEHRIVSGKDKGKNVWLKLHVGDAGYSNDYLVLTLNNTSYPSEVPDYDALVHEGATEEVRWG